MTPESEKRAIPVKMSSRVLRKLQKEQEQEKQLAALRAEAEDDNESEDEHSSSIGVKSRPVTNAFDMLEGADDDAESEPEEANEENEETDQKSGSIGPDKPTASSSTPSNLAATKKKKKKQKKGKDKSISQDTKDNAIDDMDEIDRALKELSTKHDQQSVRGGGVSGDHEEDSDERLWEILATKRLGIDSRNLNPVNEMKSLFGNIALEGSTSSRGSPRAPQRQRDQNQQGGLDLETALTGRHSPASKGKELGALANRRNVFVQGHNDWPLGTSGGLSMKSEGTLNSFEKHFSIVHSTTYMEVQREFRQCVESMQAENMIQLLRLNPYHIATLLQVSEIAKHQGDHSVSADLLERALYTFGRSVHSSFPAALRDGTVRLSFTEPNNREMYLTIWRYIQNLSMRGTWRTAFEWAKTLLQFSTVNDPYGMTLMIDQLALRGRQHVSFISLCSAEAYGQIWSHLPNIQISLSLAHLRSSQPKLARQTLALAMHQYPYILSALASALDISPLPKYLWGKLPTTDAEKLYTELYITRAKDLWNTPETTALIVEVAETISHYKDVTSAPPAPKLEISLEEARHIMLLEIPSLIALLPRKFTAMSTSSSDVLPPPDSIQQSIFTSRAPASAAATDASGFSALAAILNAASAGATAPVAGVSGLLTRAMHWFQSPADPNEPRNERGETDGAAALRELHENVPPDVVQELLQMHMTESDMDDPYHQRGADDEEFEVDSDSDRTGIPELDDLLATPHFGMTDSRPRFEYWRPEREPPIVEGPLQRSLVATVEDEDNDEEDEDDQDDLPSWSEGTVPSHPPPTHQLFVPREQSHATDPDSNNPQRVQRWLLSTGLQQLQDDTSSLAEYVRKLKGLRQRDRDWTLSIVRQRAGNALAEMVKTALES